MNFPHICLISVEIFAWGKYGGFGRATRLIGRELVKRGLQVTAVVPRRSGQAPVEDLDGIRVLSFDRRQSLSAGDLYRQVNADIYHSEEPSLGTYLAMRAMPGRKHIITFRDTATGAIGGRNFACPLSAACRSASNWLYEDNWLVHQAVRRADAHFAAAQMLIPKSRLKYRLAADPLFLPTPVAVLPDPQKATQPTVCFVSRWDKRKRPELFFELARAFPEVRFLAVGKSRDLAYDQALRQQYGNLPNLELLGFIDQFRTDELVRLLEKSWILVNTAAREGLPNAFIEAAAHGCAILSAVDPDGFASRFGQHVKDDDFASGLRALLQGDAWREKASQGHAYVSSTFSLERSIDRHLEIYQNLMNTVGVAEQPGPAAMDR